MVEKGTNESPIAGRIVALNGKFSNWKTNGLGKRDATYRFGVNIPADTPANFSPGYTGGAIRDLSDEFLGGDK